LLALVVGGLATADLLLLFCGESTQVVELLPNASDAALELADGVQVRRPISALLARLGVVLEKCQQLPGVPGIQSQWTVQKIVGGWGRRRAA
jgi:hypothetical protein